jgi:two-component system sensor histidine kinase KdpD
MTTLADTGSSGNLVVACIEDHPKAIMLLRTAKKRAQEKGIKWRAVFVETPAHLRQHDDGPHERTLRLLTMAEQMGGETAHMEAESLEKGLEHLLEREGSRIALIVLGSVEIEGRFKGFRTLSWMHMVRLASEYTQVEIVPLSGQFYRKTISERLYLRAIKPLHIVYALAAVGVSYLAALALQAILPPALFRINDHNVTLLFMISCAFVAGRFGLLPGLVASVASFLTVNYYFIVPYHALKLNSVTDMLNMVLYLWAALLISLFTSQTRDYAQKIAKRELSTQALFTLYRVAANSFTREQALEKLQRKLERMLEVNVAFFLPHELEGKRVDPAYPADLKLEDADRKALDVCWADMKTTGMASPFNPGTSWRFEPLISPAGEIGVLGIKPRSRTRMDAWFGRLLTAIADQTATVLEHIDLERSMSETRISEEREKLRSMLLSSVSHDFKTPLAGIIGALSVHRSLGEKLPQAKREELIDAAVEEAQRLDSFITNILDMTRLESGTIQFKKDWQSIHDMVDSVTRRLKHRLRQHQLVVHPFPQDIEAHIDIMMTEQVLQNVLDNACKYTQPGTLVEVSCSVSKDKGVLCEIRDHGPGLPAEKIDRVFDKYARLQKKDSQVAGTGLGLAISKTVMEAQGGLISATNHAGGGAMFTLTFPEWRRAETEQATKGGEGDAATKQAHSGH